MRRQTRGGDTLIGRSTMAFLSRLVSSTSLRARGPFVALLVMMYSPGSSFMTECCVGTEATWGGVVDPSASYRTIFYTNVGGQ